jgi:hypothetical protein
MYENIRGDRYARLHVRPAAIANTARLAFTGRMYSCEDFNSGRVIRWSRGWHLRSIPVSWLATCSRAGNGSKDHMRCGVTC